MKCAKQFKYRRVRGRYSVLDMITTELSKVNSALRRRFFRRRQTSSRQSLVSCPAYEVYRRRLLPYHAAAVLWHGTGFVPGTDAAVLGSCSRLQDRDAAAELTVKRQVEHPPVFYIRARDSRRKFTAECIIGFPFLLLCFFFYI